MIILQIQVADFASHKIEALAARHGRGVNWRPILLGVAMAPKAPEGGGEKVAFAAVKAVIDSRCISCHAAKPTQPGFAAPPAGVALETSEQIRAQAQRIHQQVVVARVMPLGNLTGISDTERALVGRWFAQGAKTD